MSFFFFKLGNQHPLICRKRYKSDRGNRDWSQLSRAGSQVSFTGDHLGSGGRAGRGRVPLAGCCGTTATRGALVEAGGICQPGSVKIATSPLRVALFHSPTLEPSLHRRAGTEQATDSIWTCRRPPV